MSNAEEIAGYKEIIDALTDFDEAYREKHAKALLDLVLQAHTNQTLQELKEEVKAHKVPIEGYNQFTSGNNEALDLVISLIDEAINE